ncbi:MAG TPA: 6-bladed beta-propeller [Solirubrobacteraceae bacterium]|nr:6-bladed beta-propeller [Solirubrobacteraceae bacterium]
MDLSLSKRNGVFESARPLVGVVLPQRAGEGAQLTESGLSLAPATGIGVPVDGSGGAIDGASVLYANTLRDTDTVFKPTIGGFEVDALLRSVKSPTRLYYRLDLPAGAMVRQERSGGPVLVSEDGRTVALILPPSAKDAAGSSVPVSMSVSGGLLDLSVSPGREQDWPIAVDPEVIDTNVAEHEGARLKSNWANEYSNAELFYEEPTIGESTVKMSTHPMEVGESMASVYPTQGESRIFDAEAWVYEEVPHGRSLFQILNSSLAEESSATLVEKGSYAWRSIGMCAKFGESPCKSTSGSAGNVLRYKQLETEPNSYAYALYSVFGYAKVYITQEKGPELSFNNTNSVIDEGRTNVMYGGGGWLSPTSGAVEMIAHDPGIGISRAGAQELSGGSYHTQISIYNENRCKGVQCNETFKNEITYSPEMSNGEDRFELWGEDMLGYFGYLGFYGNEVMIKVDGTPPHGIKVSGWGASREISAGSHLLTFEATDGEGTTPSSGVGAISVSVDGGAYSSVSVTPCVVASGPCTASGKWTLNAEGLSEGVHSLIVTAADNAGNEESEEFTFDVRHGAPVAVGPGTTDPMTGQFKLAANDVSLAGAGSLSRTFESNSLSAGAQGPFGPQWSGSLGDGQGLTVLANGSVVLRSPTGGTTTFWLDEKNEYESPPGDGNLKVEAKEKEPGKGITEYRLIETKTGFETSFTQPPGMESTTPIYAGQFGDEAGHLSNPGGIAADSKGDLWVADYSNSRIVKFSPQGAVLGVYGSPGPYSGDFLHPRDVAINQSTGAVYVTDEGNNRIVELNSGGEFVATFGWGVSNGKQEYQVCTTYCQAGFAGSGSGEFYELKGIAVDTSGNIWVADHGNNRIQEFGSAGEFLQAFGTAGSGAGQLDGPVGVAYAGEHLWLTESVTDRVQEFSTSGSYLGGHFGKEGTGTGEFLAPTGIAVDSRNGDFYVADRENHRVQEFNSSGSYVTSFGTSGTGAGQFVEPRGVVVSAGNVYVTDWGANRVSEWMRPTWLPTVSENALKTPSATYSYEAVEVEGKTVIDPVEELAPVPSKVTCGTKISELKKGCRALSFTYDTGASSAKGSSPSEWGSYKGRLMQVRFHAWDPTKGEITEPVVAEYEYDGLGRLRAEWDPRISPALKTTYGYDEEGHVTAVSPPGQEPWLIHYGSLVGDVNNGRLLSVTRPAAASSSTLKEQKAMGTPANTGSPTLSTSAPEIGVTLKVTGNGTWTNSPLSYSYRWARCQPGLVECTTIPGAVNQSYTPQAADAGYVLTGEVIAANATGVNVAGSSATGTVPLSTPSYSTSFGASGSESEKTSSPKGIAIDHEGSVWVADYGHNRVDKYSSSGAFIASYAPDAMLEPVGIAVSPTNGEVYVANRGRDRIEELSTSGTLLRTFSGEGSEPGRINAPDQIAIDQRGDLWVTDVNNERVDEFSSSGASLGSIGSYGTGNGQFNGPTGATVCGEHLYVVDQSNHRVQEFGLEGKYLGQFGSEGETNGKFKVPSEIACDPAGNDLYVTDKNAGSSRVQEFNAKGAFLNTFSGTGEAKLSEPTGVAVNASSYIYVTDSGKNRIEKWTPTYSTSNPLPEPPVAGTSSTWTVEYKVPLSGGVLPNLTEGEVARWGEKDDPVEAMAVFPPDRPMGWPAKEYERETINYMDAEGHTVNVYSPAGGISTAEYNELNEVKRTLSPDNRAIALKEVKPVEAAEKLDDRSEYYEGRLVETLGPEHMVKLQVGKEGKRDEEVSAREQVKYYYDEGSPEGKEYGLLTRTVDSALVAGKKEEARVTSTYYSGQEGLGWTLRKPTSVVTDPAGLDLVHTTVYDKTTGNVVETKAPGGIAETVYPPSFDFPIGSEGSGSGQFNHPEGTAVDPSGNLWVVDKVNDRIEEFSSSGTFIAAYGSEGSGSLQFLEPWGIAVSPTTGNVFVGDAGNNRIEELNNKGEYVRSIGAVGTENGQLKAPAGVTIDAKGDVWVADEGNDRVQEFSETGEYKSKFGSKGSGEAQFEEPVNIAISEGQLYVVDRGNNRIQEFSTNGTYLDQIGTNGKGPGQFTEPTGIAVNPTTGDLYVTDLNEPRVQQFSPAGKFLTEWETWGKSHEVSNPVGIAINNTGRLYISDRYAGQVTAWTLPETGGAQLKYGAVIGGGGKAEGQFEEPYSMGMDGEGDLWISDHKNNRIEKFSTKGTVLSSYGTTGTGNLQFKGPWGVTVNKSTGNVYIADSENNRVQELSSTGTFIRTFGTSGSGTLEDPAGLTIDASGDVWVADYGHNRIVEFSSTGTYLVAYGSYGTGEKQFNGPTDITSSASNLYISDVGNDRIQELSTTGTYIRSFGHEGSGSSEFYGPFGITADAAGNIYVIDKGNSRIQEFSPAGNFLATFASQGAGEGQLNEPTGLTVSSSGDMYIADTGNNRIEHWEPAERAAHDIKSIYYTPEGEAETSECRNHPEWANLPCQIMPAAQPTNTTASSVPIITQVYNALDEITKTTETFPANEHFTATTRTKTETYDAAGRAITSEETATTGTSQPTTTNKYNSETGALEEQSTKEGATKIVNGDNTLGQLVSYTDADGSTTKYLYDIDGRTEEVSDPKGKQSYAYDGKTGLMTKLVDSGAGTLTATYDGEGRMLTEGLPDGLLAKYTYDATGTATGIEYEKKAHCEKTCPETWFSDMVVPSIHGETVTQVSSLSDEAYMYDPTGRLTETQETTPSAKTCKARLYAYDEEGNRLSQTNRESSTETCPTEGGTIERHVYDAANRLIDNEVSYDALGDETKLPAVDAGKFELKSSFYNDGQVSIQTQHEETIEYNYDPSGRTRETTAKGIKTIAHYAAAGEALDWSDEGGGKWSRNVTGIDGALDAIQSSAGTTTLQIHDLRGNIVAQAGVSESETKLQASFASAEFGVPVGSKTPAKYAWLGADGVSTEFETGISAEGGTSYVPQIAKDIETASVVPPGAFPDGSGPGSPEETVIPGWITAINEAESSATLAEWAAIQAAESEASCTADPSSCVSDPYRHGNFAVVNIEDLVSVFRVYLEMFHDAELGLYVAGGAEDLVTVAGIGIFVDFSKVSPKAWVEFFSESILALEDDERRLKNRGPKDAEYLSVGEWYYERENKKEKFTEELPYAIKLTWCWLTPRSWCSSKSKTYELKK